MLSTDFLGNAVRSMLASVLSMYPLLKKDGLSAAYWGLALIYVGLSAIASSVLQQIQVTAVKKRTNPVAKGGVLLLVSSIGFLCIHAVSVWCKPPAKYPYLWDALMVTWGFIHFAEMIARLYYKHFRLFIDSTTPRS